MYTYVDQIGTKILHRWVDEQGVRHSEWGNFCPTLYVQSNKENNEFRGIRQEKLSPVDFDSIWDARQFVQKYQGVDNFPIYGNQNWWAQFIQENYTGEVEWDIEKLTIATLDIECRMDTGFPNPQIAPSELTCISVGVKGDVYVFATKDFETDDDKVIFQWCETEEELLHYFLKCWRMLEPDIVTGWNVQGFDIPYMVNRIKRVLGDDYANQMAPTAKKYTKKCINEREFDGEVEYTLNGISVIDYMRLYKKFTYKMRERYSLDFIAHVELGEKKLDYSEYGNLDDLWEQNPQRYIEYNIHDVRLVERLDEKLNLMMLITTLTYMCHIRFEDVFSQVRMWDTLIYNKMLDDNVVIPPKQTFSKSEKYEGAYVRDPEIGMHEWVVSFDLNSLYPHLIMQYNISPEKLIDSESVDNPLLFGLEGLIEGTADTDFLKDMNLSMTANKAFFERDSQGFLPQMMESLYSQRKDVKKQMLVHEQDVENIKSILHERGITDV